MLDVGAAAGTMTRKMLEMSPQSRAIGFEPFPGNFPYIEKAYAKDSRLTLIKKAVSNHTRSARFWVPSTTPRGQWAHREGYSSGGRVVSDGDDRETVTVETCRLDDVVSEPVRFLKVDTQGHEFEVLDGAKNLFDRHGVELALVEFQGDRRVVSFLAQRGYAVLDSEYLCTQRKVAFDRHWRVLRTSRLSTGGKVARAIPINAPKGPDAFCDWFDKQLEKYGAIWTDLIAIAPGSRLLSARESLWTRILSTLKATGHHAGTRA